MAQRSIVSILFGLATIVAIIGFLAIEINPGGDRSRGDVSIIAQIPFSLLDDEGVSVNESTYRGKLNLVFFGFTHCPDICPIQLSAISSTLDMLEDDAAALEVLFISIDPELDTPPVMAAYLQHFHPKITGLTGDLAEIRHVADAYHVYFEKAVPVLDMPTADHSAHVNDENRPVPDPQLVNHTGLAYLVDEEGRYLTHFSPGATPDAMARAIRQHI